MTPPMKANSNNLSVPLFYSRTYLIPFQFKNTRIFNHKPLKTTKTVLIYFILCNLFSLLFFVQDVFIELYCISFNLLI